MRERKEQKGRNARNAGEERKKERERNKNKEGAEER